MRRIHTLAVTLAFALPGYSQQIDHHRIVDLEDGPATAVELERAGYTVVEGGIGPDSVEIHTLAVEVAALQNQGYELELISLGRPLQEIMGELIDPGTEGVPTGYPTVATMIARMNAAEANFPGIARVINLTTTYGMPLTQDGNEMFAIKISDNVGTEEDEPSMFVMCQQHSNEIGTGVVALTAIDKLTQDYATDPAIQAVVDGNEIFIAPTWNPDGVDYVHFVSANWRKNRRDNGNGTFGVDLNRNYSAGWTASCSGSTNTNSGNYKGTSIFSEPETMTCVSFANDQQFAKMIEYHSAGRETLWEFNCTTHPFAGFMLQAAQLLSTASGYGTANRPPSAEGEHYEWEFTRGAWSHLIEISNSQQPSHASALAEADQVFPGIVWMLEQPFWFNGHVTDACSGAAVEADISFAGVTIPYGGTFSSTSDFGRYDLMPQAGSYTVDFAAAGYATQSFPVTIVAGSPTTLDVALVPTSSVAQQYCTAGTSASGCQATLSATGTASASAASGFTVDAAGVEGNANGQYYYGTNGRQANPWGNGSSFRCVIPPTNRAGVASSGGTNGGCDGAFTQDLNALWTAKPAANPGAGATVQLQYWYRDPQSTSNQTTSFSDALELGVCP